MPEPDWTDIDEIDGADELDAWLRTLTPADWDEADRLYDALPAGVRGIYDNERVEPLRHVPYRREA